MGGFSRLSAVQQHPAQGCLGGRGGGVARVLEEKLQQAPFRGVQVAELSLGQSQGV